MKRSAPSPVRPHRSSEARSAVRQSNPAPRLAARSRILALGSSLLLSAAAAGGSVVLGEDMADGEIRIAPPLPMPGPTMEARDIREEGVLAQRIRVHFHWYLPVVRESLSDGDVAVRGPDGYHQRGRLVSVEEIAEPFPMPLTAIPEHEDDWIRFHEPMPTLVATYEVSSPAGPDQPWTADDNGTYTVDLVADQVVLADGSSLPPKLLGGFRVLVGIEDVPVCPVDARIAIESEPLFHPDDPAIPLDDLVLPPPVYWADVAAAFSVHNVTVRHWGEAVRLEGNTFVAEIDAVHLPLPDDERPPEPGIGDAEGDPADLLPAPATILRHRYHLGPLEPGDYRFVLRCGDARVAVGEWTVPEVADPVDRTPPGAQLTARNVGEAGAETHRLRVEYADRSGVRLGSIGDGDMFVLSPCFGLDADAAGFPCEWSSQPGRLVEVETSDDGLRAVAVYEIDAPKGGWTHRHNGFYPVVLAGGAVCDQAGNCSGRARLGGFEVAIRPDGGGGDDPPVAADAEIRVGASDPSAVHARVHIEYREHFRVVETSVRREGALIVLEAVAKPVPVIAIFPPPPPGSEVVDFRIGALEPGDYAAAFRMNGTIYDVVPFSVGLPPDPPIDAAVDLTVDPAGPSVTAHAIIQFADPYVVLTDPGTPRLLDDGRTIAIDARAERVNFIRPPDGLPVEAKYDLGPLRPGRYELVYRINRLILATAAFAVGDEPEPIPADVELTVDGVADPVVAKVVVQFHDHYRIVAQEVVRDPAGNFLLTARVEGPLPILAPIPPPPRTLEYSLGHLPPGGYSAVFAMNGSVYARTEFRVPRHDPPPPPSGVSVAFIEVTQDDTDEHNADVGIAIADRSLTVIDWGTVERGDNNRFHVNLFVAVREEVPPPVPGDPDPGNDGIADAIEGFEIGPDGQLLVGGFPIRLERHRYSLGLVGPGEHQFVVSINGALAGRWGFRVDGHGAGPTARLGAADVTAPGSDPHRVHIQFHDRSGLDHDSIQSAELRVDGPDGITVPAVLSEYASTDDVPGTGAFATYELSAPGGSWGPEDRGLYRIAIDPDAVRDLDGNVLAEGRLGGFAVRLWPDPPMPPHPLPNRGVEVKVGMNEGVWFADVSVHPRPGFVLEAADWGAITPRGHALVAQADLLESPLIDETDDSNDPILPPAGEPLRHRYVLGELVPGHYLFLFRSDLGHAGLSPLRVPGMEPDPVEGWRQLLLAEDAQNPGGTDGSWYEQEDGDRDGHPLFAEFAWGLDPRRADQPEIEPEVVVDENGNRHLGLRFLRPLTSTFDVRFLIEVSRDLREWTAADDQLVEVLDRTMDLDGSERVRICLRQALDDELLADNEGFRYLRVRAVRDASSVDPNSLTP